MNKATIDAQEIAKFAEHASEWWNTEGPLKTLHDINPARMEFILNHTSLKDLNVLDIGCGGGVLSEAMAEKGALVTGLDVEPEAIAAAKKHAKEKKLKLHYVCQAIETFDDKDFDVITCMEMLEHVPSPQPIIHHCARLLKPQGYLFLSTINRTFHAYATVILAAEYVLGLLPKQTHDYKKFIKPSELAAMLRQEGLELIAIKGMSYNPINRKATLQENVKANYLLVCRKS